MKILVVEDNTIACLAETRLVKMCNCEVDEAHDGAETLEKVKNEHYDLIFMDIGLPDTTGFKLAEIIRGGNGNNQKVPIIALTAHESADYRIQAAEIGMDDYLVKPLTLETCKDTLKKYLSMDF